MNGKSRHKRTLEGFRCISTRREAEFEKGGRFLDLGDKRVAQEDPRGDHKGAATEFGEFQTPPSSFMFSFEFQSVITLVIF